MSPIKGHFSIVQYCPDLARLEAANVGVVLFCPEPHFLRVRTTNSVQRIRRFFGSEDHDWDQIRALVSSVEERLEVEAESFRAPADLEHFIATRGNEVQLTPLRSVKVFDPEQDLELLYRRLVGGQVSHREIILAAERLEESLAAPDLDAFLHRRVTVTVRAFHRSMTAPFGYQNGRFNLIQPARFKGLAPSKAINRACRLAVEGRSLYEHPDDERGDLRLVVVGDFAPEQAEARAVVSDIFEENEVHLFTLAEIPRLVDEIRKTAKVRTA